MSFDNVYTLSNFNDEISHQLVEFYELDENGSPIRGTTLEEMLRVSIQRLQDLNSKFSCRENSLAITKMEEALMWLNKRTEDRVKRGVEGQHKA